jgi:RNA polymerase sigma factor (sigma-70 family)
MKSSQGLPFVSISTAERLLAKAAPPADWKLTTEEFRCVLERSVAHRFAGAGRSDKSAEADSPLAPAATSIEPQSLDTYLEALNVADLALACACGAGRDAAWDYFVALHRPGLYRAARAIAGEGSARDLADSLYADLYGLRETAEGKRRSLFDYFHGRSKLTTWLRAVMAQRHVDEFRRTRHTEWLDDPDENDERTQPVSGTRAPDPERNAYLAMLQATLTAVLGALEPRNRLRLAYYYADDLTLAQIGKLLGEHEATVSRKLERTRREVRRKVEAALREEKKLSEAQLRLCYEYAREEWPFDLTGALSARE